MAERMLKQGVGWRIGWNPQASKFKGLLGGENWAIELTEAELNDFCRLLDQLMTTLRQMQMELMEEEKITCEAETDLLWIQVEGCPPTYQLHLILNTERRSEGSWSADALPELIAATKLLKTF